MARESITNKSRMGGADTKRDCARDEEGREGGEGDVNDGGSVKRVTAVKGRD